MTALAFLASFVLLETSLAPSLFVSSMLPKSWGQIQSGVSLYLNNKEELGVLNMFDKDDTSSDLLLTTLPGSAGLISLKLNMYLAVSVLHLPREIAGGCGASLVPVEAAKSKGLP